MGAIISHYSNALIPTFLIKLTHGGKSKTVVAGFDTGLEGADIEIPSSMAYELGISVQTTMVASDSTMTFNQSIGTIDEISVPSVSNCVLRPGIVSFFNGATQVLIGINFLKALGAEIAYQGTPTLTCRGYSAGTEQMIAPSFAITLVQGQKVLNTTALFDTGFTSDLLVTAQVAQMMGLRATGIQQAKTHTGTVGLGIAKLDRLSLKDIPQCNLTDVDVRIQSASSPLQDILVGEGFIEKVGGRIGYDRQGALFSCENAKGMIARPIAITRVASNLIPLAITPQLWLFLGAIGLIGAVTVGYLLISGSSSEAPPSA